ncbi:tetraacyldisaccharide 4'-kinase [Candidatus Pandoraea novymonadis]|nr:tetraacyldisaccharide 4'-kinase [Candidatus Pandoraea novymonadis]
MTAQWQRHSWITWLLLPLSWIFFTISSMRRLCFRLGCYRSKRLSVPTVVVGNLTVGGTGKTPVVIALIEVLRNAGFTPGVLSRGYGARLTEPRSVKENDVATDVGDEPLLIYHRTGAPIVVWPSRVEGGKSLLAEHPECNVIICDDGLQHYKLARDIEIAVFDHRLAGNGFHLPAGPLREPLSRPRDANLVNDPYDTPLPPWPNTWRLNISLGEAWCVSQPTLRRPLSYFTNNEVLAAAGIGAPERFFFSLRNAGLTLQTMALADHFDFAYNPFKTVTANTILITEKDAVKCLSWSDPRLWAVSAFAVLDTRLVSLVLEKLSGHSTV